MSGRSSVLRRTGLVLAFVAVAVVGTAGVVAASNVAGGLTQSRGDVSVPTWLYLATGGGVIGASALLTMLVTDRGVIGRFHDDSRSVALETLVRAGSLLLGSLGVFALAFVVVVGLLGPQQTGNSNGGVLVTFVGGRALLTMVAYAVGNPWRAIDPWRRIAGAVPNGYREYPDWLASWPAVVGLLGLVWFELVAPVSSSPRTLAVAVLAYSVYTVAGGVVFTPAVWFERADPLSVWFRLYGSVAPVGRTDDGLEIRYPGAALTDDDVVTDRSVVAFVLVLVWELTYSGFVVTEPGARTVEALVGVGLPAELVYLGLLLAGLGLFWAVYWLAAGRTRARAETYLSRRYVGLRFAAPLLAIAAGYHAAHYAGFAVSLWPSLVETVAAPLDPPANPTQYGLTAWFGYVEIASILLGHALAVWIAHSVSFELFPGKLQAIRSQYPFIVVMIGFTMVSLLLVSLPTVPAPFVPG